MCRGVDIERLKTTSQNPEVGSEKEHDANAGRAGCLGVGQAKFCLNGPEGAASKADALVSLQTWRM